MDRYKHFLREVLQLAGEIYFRWVDAELWKFGEAIHDWLYELIPHPNPHWRESLAELLAQQEAEGRLLLPESRQALIEHLELWEATVDWSAISGETSTPSADITSVVQLDLARDQDETTRGAPRATTEPAPPQTPVPKNWPVLTPEEREAAQRSTGLPGWYPLQPRNRMDAVWERRLVDLGQAARDRLLDFFREVAALGRMAGAIGDRAIEEFEEVDLEPLAAQCDKIQTAYDQYLAGKVEVYREWTRYLSMETFVGPEVVKVFTKIDNGLPDRVEGFKSPADESLKGARRAAEEATDRKVRRTDAAYTALVWTDRVLTIIEIATLVGTAKAVFTQTTKTMVAKGLSVAAARKVAMTQVVVHVATAAASAAAVAGVLPRVLSAAGLDESEVRAGLAVFRAAFTILGLRAVARQGRTQRSLEDGGQSKVVIPRSLERRRKLSPEQAKRARGTAFNRAQASKYPYNEIPVAKPDGGKPYVLDSYDPIKGEIVFRRETQFSEITLRSAMAYLKEFVKKYPPGRTIANVPSSKDLAGTVLSGKMIFEVPPQWKAIPKPVLDEATRLDILIRDSNGKIYNPH